MKIREIKALSEVLKDFDLSAIEVTEGDNKIRIERNMYPAAVQNPAPQSYSPAVAAGNPVQDAGTEPSKSSPDTKASGLTEVKSPMVGVFYCAPSPDSDPFVTVGSRVKKGDVLCIIEAMKLMNEINAESDGEVVEICLENGMVVEYGQPLFRLK